MLRPLLFLLLVAGTAAAAPAFRPRPALVLVGGALEDPRIVDEILRLAGGAARARIGVITAASGQPEQGARYYRELFRKHGVSQVEWLPVDTKHKALARSASLAERAGELNVFFLGGGDQSRLVSCLIEKDGRDTPLLAAMKTAYSRGAVVAGTSAGAAGQACGVMITGGESANALRDGAREGRLRDGAREGRHRDGAREGRHRGAELTYRRGGLGFFPFGIPDTHFAQRGRQGRLIRLAADTGTRRAFGIDENTALIVEKPLTARPSLRVLGKGNVTMYDLSRARPVEGTSWSLRGLSTRLLCDGDRCSLDR